MEEKRVLLAFVLMFIVLVAYQAFFVPPTPTPQAQPSGAASASQTPAPAATPAAVAPEASQPAVAEAAPLVAESSEREVVVENAAVRAVFTSRGAVLKSWKLKKYQDAKGQALELVPQNVPADRAKAFSLSVADAGVTDRLQKALFKLSSGEPTPDAPATLTFDYADSSGLTAHKEFSVVPTDPYILQFSGSVSKGQPLPATLELGPGIGSGLVSSSATTYSPPSQPLFYRDGSVTRVKPANIAANPVQDGVFGFAGVDDHYFLAAALSPGQPLQIHYRALDVPAATPEQSTHFIEWSIASQSQPVKARFFLGPKDFDVLAAVDRNLVRAIDFGMFAWIVVPLLRALKWVNGFAGNYGWSIIILTVLINLAMFPLRHKSVVSMRRMQEIQPEVKAIQDRYAKLKMSDPARQKMNAELMTLYRERGVNPASGCVPMLLTLPVLFAFYSMLSVAIELRGAPFIGWIKDLSVHDPLFITPVLMGVTQFVQTRMTPTTADPMQQKMMMFMPLIMMTMFIWAPSGLVLYWTVSNMWAIGQQAVTNRLIGPAQQRTIRPPAERRVKSAGGGRTDQAAKERK